jgi:hypothetical protein
MNTIRKPLTNRLIAIRNLTTSCIGNLLSDQELEIYNISKDIRSSLGNLGHKIRTRLDSYRTVLQLEDTDTGQRSATELARSLISFLPDIIKILDDFHILEDDKNSEEIRNAIDKFIDFFESLGENNDAITREAQSFPLKLKEKIGGPAAYLCAVKLSLRIAESIEFDSHNNLDRIHREIKFPPEYQQAGLAILHYFSEVLAQKYPDKPITVSIKQIGFRVVLEITTLDGSVEQIERVLEQYGMVVQGAMRPNDFLDDPIAVMRLTQKLELVNIELKQTREILQLQKDYSGARIKSLEDQISTLTNIVGAELRSRESLLAAFTAASNSNIQELAPRVLELLNTLSKATADRNASQVALTLENLETAAPKTFTTLCQFIYSSAAAGVIGESAVNWLKALFPPLAK